MKTRSQDEVASSPRILEWVPAPDVIALESQYCAKITKLNVRTVELEASLKCAVNGMDTEQSRREAAEAKVAEFESERERVLARSAEVSSVRLESPLACLNASIDAADVLARSVNAHGSKIAELERERDELIESNDMGSNAEIVAKCNELARKLYSMQGYVVSGDFNFYNSTHPHELLCWEMASRAFEFLKATEMEDVLDQHLDDVLTEYMEGSDDGKEGGHGRVT